MGRHKPYTALPVAVSLQPSWVSQGLVLQLCDLFLCPKSLVLGGVPEAFDPIYHFLPLFFFPAVLRFELRAYILSHCRVLRTICPGWLQIVILLFSAS
jgi:hypothetical protein